METATADATWSGALPDGTGDVALGSDAWVGRCATAAATDTTNPAELLAAACASWFSMTAADVLDEAGYTPCAVETEATVAPARIDTEHTGPAVELAATGVVPDVTAAEFAAILEAAVEQCPLSAVLGGASITVEATLAD